MQPYQAAAEVTRKSGELPLDLLKYAGIGGIGKVGSIAAKKTIERMIPLLSDLIPESFAKKGLSLINPKFGEYIDKAEDEGYEFSEIKDNLKSKIESSQGNKQPAKETRNIIEQYDPELDVYLKEKLGKGEPLLEAGKRALGHGRFKKAVDKMIKDHKTTWDTILQSVYGNNQPQEQNPQQQQQQQQQAPQQHQAQGQGQGAQALMSILEKIHQFRGGK